MSEGDLEVLRDQYDAVNERDWGRAMSHYADDVRLTVHPEFLNSGIYEGSQAVGEWFGDWFRSFDRDFKFEISELTELDDGRILLRARTSGRGRASGAPLEGEVIWSYRMRDGKVAEITGHDSREQAVQSREER